jgi:PIN domain nuclease of toxin-antitoxin system
VTLAVLDTHALIWAIGGEHRRLGKKARKLIADADRGVAALYVATISLVEVSEAARRGSLTLAGGFSIWVEGLVASGRYHPCDLTTAIVLRAESLYSIPERSDRLIAATAAELDVPLCTRDPAIAAAAGVDIVW